MKKAFCLILTAVFVFSLQASADQIEFKYDACGNCIQKVKTIVMGTRSKSASKAAQAVGNEEQASTLDEWDNGTELYIYPNPTRGVLKLEFRGTLPSDAYQLRLSDMKGTVWQQTESTSPSLTLDMTAYPAGMYLLQIQYGQEAKEWKILKE